ncbi:ArsA family ATPase [Mumia qirimensis]|uniref:ArsA family ATPase n=1 Tax=Mumia qirimensis TaxID=3234852 RepID=UPI00351D989A
MSRSRTRSRRIDGAGVDPATALDVDAIIDDHTIEIVVCCGAGGVGKTTTAAAIALRAAERGRKVCVLTIDPARRLAQSLGLTALDNVPRPVTDAGADGGSLDAMMLDMKRTFDEVVVAHASPEKAAQIFENPFYVALSSSFAGTQEYMAMEKLGQLHAEAVAGGADSADGSERRWDLIVVDTPPSRSALDFLDAPERLSSLLDGRLIRLLLAPARGPARLFSAGFGMITSALNKVLGAQVLTDVQTFVASFDTLFGGFRQRAEATFALLQDRGTAFLVIASPEPDAMREASYFVERLSQDAMPLAGLVVNRMTVPSLALDGDDAHATARRLRGRTRPTADDRVVAALLDVHARGMRVAERERRVVKSFVAAHPRVRRVELPSLATDVHDLAGLAEIGERLAGPAPAPTMVD